MPDVTIDEVDPSPPPAASVDPPSNAEDANDDQISPPRIRAYEGSVTAAVSVWLPGPEGRPLKHYDTRIRYRTSEGLQNLRITVPSIDFLAVGTKVDVEEQASGRIRVHKRPQLAPVAGRSWKRPDVKTAVVVLIIILTLTLVIGVIGYLVARTKGSTAPPTPSVTVQPTVNAPR